MATSAHNTATATNVVLRVASPRRWPIPSCVALVLLAACGTTNEISDLCPDDVAKSEAGACGCGVPDDDTNGNGVPDCLDAGVDLCPADPTKTQAGVCGCGVSDDDTNSNGVPDCLDAGIDLCPNDPAKTQAGACGCGVSDVDADGSGAPDCFDPPNPTFFPDTCKSVQDKALADTGVRPADGTYTLYVAGDASKPWDAYCRRMNLATPIEYVTVSEPDNFSQVSNGVDVAVTRYRRLRIDPTTLTIDPVDSAFASTETTGTFQPVLTTGESALPAGWAEFQPFRADDGPAAESRVSLAGTPFAFHEDILANNLQDFFCTVSDAATQAGDDAGSSVSVAADLKSFQLVAINSNSNDVPTGIVTREVAACGDLGPGSTFETAAWPLVYVGVE